VDPQKDSQAALQRIDGGLHTRTRELEEQGLDIEEIFDELAYEEELAKERGLSFVSDPSRQPSTSSQDIPEDQVPNESGTAGEGEKPSDTKPGNGKPDGNKPSGNKPKNNGK
jgi:capsid protein